ncbi:hypothetical protein [Streptomyces coeruleorubidus]|uniref:hypothetical protein n=1 Tax=Streptomyces coeruleorubidus TaxID=116188 RepID=UPI003668327F
MKTGEGWLAIWPVVAFFLGGLATQVAGWINHRRQRAEKAEDAMAEVRRRREEFELAHLVDCNELMRQARTRLGEYSTALRNYHNARADDQLTSEVGQAFTDSCIAFETAHANLASQVGFIFDDEVRRLVQAGAEQLVSTYERLLFSDDVEDERLDVDGPLNEAYVALSSRVRIIYAGRAA